ncbi:hypothetical protein [Desulfotomaculum sp. 1211_IL3151]|uniref:hypothetical protein n=1 Tax=Desulfotomaculum sp. 1211_IL3151 TaxID=3084055 RepID=UPI002FD9990A
MAQYKVLRKNRQLQLPDPCHCYQNDHVDLVVEGAGIRLCRLSSLSVPAEVSAYIPRVEIRHRTYDNGQLVSEDERIYNSITVVHAPRHPLENPKGPIPHKGTFPVWPGGFNNSASQLESPEDPTLEPLTSGGQPSPPGVPVEPGPNQPGASQPPVIPSQPEPHPPPVSPRRKKNPPLPSLPKVLPARDGGPFITINKQPFHE